MQLSVQSGGGKVEVIVDGAWLRVVRVEGEERRDRKRERKKKK